MVGDGIRFSGVGPSAMTRAMFQEYLMCSSVVPAVPWIVIVELPLIAAARCSESQLLPVPGSPTSRRARSDARVTIDRSTMPSSPKNLRVIGTSTLLPSILALSGLAADDVGEDEPGATAASWPAASPSRSAGGLRAGRRSRPRPARAGCRRRRPASAVRGRSSWPWYSAGCRYGQKEEEPRITRMNTNEDRANLSLPRGSFESRDKLQNGLNLFVNIRVIRGCILPLLFRDGVR